MKYILFCLLFAVTTPALAAEPVLDIQEVQSENGLKAWLVEDHSIPVIALQFAFLNSGAKNDPADKQGLARLASNTMDEGAGDLTSNAFQKKLLDQSITLVFNTSRDHFGGQLKTLTRNKDEAFSLLKLAVSAPRFDEEAVERMRASNISRIKSSVANPKWVAARIQNDRIFEGHPYANNSGGTLSSLASITPDDLRAFHKNLGKNNLVIGASGNITSDELKTILDQVFGDLPNIERAEPAHEYLANAGKTYIYNQDIPQTVIEIAQEGVSRSDKDYDAAQVMNFILGESGFGSRLMEEIREKRGLTYGIYSYFREYNEANTLQISTSTMNESVSEMLSLIQSEWDKMVNTAVTDKEIADAKSYIIGSLPLSLTSTNAIASIALGLQLDQLPIDYLDHHKERVDAVKIQDITNAAKRILDKNSLTTILVGKPENIENAEIITVIPNVE